MSSIAVRGIASRSSISRESGSSRVSTNSRTERCSVSGFALEQLAERSRDARRAAGRAVDHHLDRARLRAVHPVRAIDRVLERPRRVADLANPHLDVVLLVETKRHAIAHTRLTDREVEPLGDEVAVVHDVEGAEIGDAADLGEEQVVRVVDDALKVRLAIADALAVSEGEFHAPAG